MTTLTTSEPTAECELCSGEGEYYVDTCEEPGLETVTCSECPAATEIRRARVAARVAARKAVRDGDPCVACGFGSQPTDTSVVAGRGLFCSVACMEGRS